jgi:serine/threonine-protein kinase
MKRKAAVAKSGTLSLQTTPWTNVYFGETFLGETPLLEVPMPAGRHFLRLVTGEGTLAATVEVEIVAGKQTTLRLKL